MKRIQIIESNQGKFFNRIQDECWERLLQLDNGYFEKIDNTFLFYTNDGLLIRTVKNSGTFWAKRFENNENEMIVEYCEPGLGLSIIEELNTTTDEFMLRNTGFYDPFGDSYFIKFKLADNLQDYKIPNVWNFEVSFSKDQINQLKKYLFNNVFEAPKKGQLCYKLDNESEFHYLIFEGDYYRTLKTKMNYLQSHDYDNIDKGWHSIASSLSVPKLVKATQNLKDFS